MTTRFMTSLVPTLTRVLVTAGCAGAMASVSAADEQPAPLPRIEPIQITPIAPVKPLSPPPGGQSGSSAPVPRPAPAAAAPAPAPAPAAAPAAPAVAAPAPATARTPAATPPAGPSPGLTGPALRASQQSSPSDPNEAIRRAVRERMLGEGDVIFRTSDLIPSTVAAPPAGASSGPAASMVQQGAQGGVAVPSQTGAASAPAALPALPPKPDHRGWVRFP